MFRQRKREKGGEGEGDGERERLFGCFPHVLQLGIEPTAWVYALTRD